MRPSLVLLAGDVGYDRFLVRGVNKALLEVQNLPLIVHTLDAVRRTVRFDELIVVGPPAVLAGLPFALDHLRVIRLAQEEDVAGNLEAALEIVRRRDSDGGAVVLTNDAPLVSPEELDDMAAALAASNAEAIVLVNRVSAEQLVTPIGCAYRRSMLPLRDGAYLLGNVFGLRASAAELIGEIQAWFTLRKQTTLPSKINTLKYILRKRIPLPVAFRWTRLVAAKALWGLLPNSDIPRQVSIPLPVVEQSLAEVLGGRSRIELLATSRSGACWDIDTEQQFIAISGLLANRPVGEIQGEGRKSA
jgi:CTP:molybdopterin cytidylyltransferase MocA